MSSSALLLIFCCMLLLGWCSCDDHNDDFLPWFHSGASNVAVLCVVEDTLLYIKALFWCDYDSKIQTKQQNIAIKKNLLKQLTPHCQDKYITTNGETRKVWWPCLKFCCGWSTSSLLQILVDPIISSCLMYTMALFHSLPIHGLMYTSLCIRAKYWLYRLV